MSDDTRPPELEAALRRHLTDTPYTQPPEHLEIARTRARIALCAAQRRSGWLRRLVDRFTKGAAT